MPDVGRFFNIDLLSEKYAYQSQYNFSENGVVDARELEGLEVVDFRKKIMKTVTKIILIISVIYTVLLLYFQYDYFLEFIPLVIVLLAINFYMIYKYNNKLLNFILNGLLFVFLIFCFSFGVALRQDW